MPRKGLFRPATPEQLRVREQETGIVISAAGNNDYTLNAAIDLERAQGLSLEEELIRHLGREVRQHLDEQILQGFRGADFLEAGMVYLPYVPLYTTPTIVADDLAGQRGFLHAQANSIGV